MIRDSKRWVVIAAALAVAIATPAVTSAATPVISALSLSPRTIHPTTTARLQFRLSAPATVKMTVQRAVAGRRHGALCTRPDASNRRGKPCTRYVATPGHRTWQGRAGINEATVTRAAVGHVLRPGHYQLALVPIDASGQRGTPGTITFNVAAR